MLIRSGAGARGRIADLSAGGVRFLLGAGEPRCRRGDPIELELRLDGAVGTWSRFTGTVLRARAGGRVAVAFARTPLAFEDVVQSELLAMIACAQVVHVLLVDPEPQRRMTLAATLRAAGCHVTDVAAPLDALAHLGESREHPRLIAIADTVPPSIADDLRAFLGTAHSAIRLIRVETGTP